VLALLMVLGACAQRGPQGLEFSANTYLKLPRELVFVPAR